MFWYVRLVFISQTAERVEITFRNGSRRTRKVIRGLQFSFVFFQRDFLLYMNVLSFLNKQLVEKRKSAVDIKYVFHLVS